MMQSGANMDCHAFSTQYFYFSAVYTTKTIHHKLSIICFCSYPAQVYMSQSHQLENASIQKQLLKLNTGGKHSSMTKSWFLFFLLHSHVSKSVCHHSTQCFCSLYMHCLDTWLNWSASARPCGWLLNQNELLFDSCVWNMERHTIRPETSSTFHCNYFWASAHHPGYEHLSTVEHRPSR